MYDYDLIAIGSGPAGQRAVIQAAKLGKRAAVVECRQIGGVCVIAGTIPSKTLREAVLHLTGFMQRGVYGQSYRVKEEITVEDLRGRYQDVIKHETDVIRDQLTRNHVTLLDGLAGFVDPHTLEVTGSHGVATRRVTAEHIVIATGTKPARPPDVEFDGRTIFDSDSLMDVDRVPGSLVVVGAGVVGIEYASVFAALGSKVTVIDKRRRILDICDDEIVEALQHHLRDLMVSFRLGEEVVAVESLEGGALVQLKSGKRIAADVVLYSAGRLGATEELNLQAAGLQADDRGRIPVDGSYRTAVPHIFAVGDVIGFPSLAATAMEQGRIAALEAFGQEHRSVPELFPIGIYTIPEIGFVGRTEQELTEAATPYEVGVARFRELARGAIMAESHGMLKILVSSEDRRLLGVHALGSGATELVHIGQAVMGNDGSLDYLLDTVFNYPTLAEAYKVAALDANNRLRATQHLGR